MDVKEDMQVQGKVSAPGRLCLFGEHQDYLSLPIIACAVDKRLSISFTGSKKNVKNSLLVSSENFDLEELIQYDSPKLKKTIYDYISAILIYYSRDKLFPANLKFQPETFTISSDIPIGSGMSSSAALLVAGVTIFQHLALSKNLDPISIAEIAYQCERKILGIACGRMDQYASSIGSTFHMTSVENPHITPLTFPDCYLIVGDSLVKRKADTPLKAVQKDIFEALRLFPNVNLNEITMEEIVDSDINQIGLKRLQGVIGIRENTINALNELKKNNPNLTYLGDFINKQQCFLRDNYEVSHPKLDEMCEVAVNNGALGAKLSGAGFGGVMFAISNNFSIAQRIKHELDLIGKSTITSIDEGIKILE